MSSIVVPDACVLIPAALRDIIFRAYVANTYQMRLTDSIVEEVRRNLVRKMSVREDKAQRLVEVIRIEFSECFVFPKEHLISSMQPQTPVFANLLKAEFTQRDKKPWIRSLGNISDIL
jgi:hypothetical protein